MIDLTDRINATIRHAQGRIERATFKVEYDEWREVLRLLEDIRDDYGKRPADLPESEANNLIQVLDAIPKRGPGRPRKEPQPPEAA